MWNRKRNMKNKKELNGSDNWYAEEKKRESRISAWDFDEKRKLAEEHQTLHQDSGTKRQRNNGTSDPFFVLDLILFSLIIPFSVAIPGHSLIPMLVLFLFLSMGVILWESIGKKFPPRWYFILVLILTIVMESIALLEVL